MVLRVNWKDFKNEIESYISAGNILLEKHKNSRTEDNFNELKNEKQSWEKAVVEYVKPSFEPEYINFAYELRAQQGYNLGFKQNAQQKINSTLDALREEINNLDYYSKILFISDAVVRPDEIDLEKRKSLDTEGKLDLILSKLYDLYKDRKYHSIKRILDGNGVELSHGEDWDYGRMLENRGLIECLNGKNVNAKLTLEGKYAIEQARKARVPDYSKISSSHEELKELIKKVLSEIEKLGYGQQIIFDEFDELRKDIPHLSKKSFGQLLKSKLGDLVATKALEETMASEIFKEFTGEIIPF